MVFLLYVSNLLISLRADSFTQVYVLRDGTYRMDASQALTGAQCHALTLLHRLTNSFLSFWITWLYFHFWSHQNPARKEEMKGSISEKKEEIHVKERLS